MTALTLEHHNRRQLSMLLTDDTWVVACLCAAWCDVCGSFRNGFDELAASHPDKSFVWIDIEDQADIVGDLDIDNFPTLLIQRGDNIAFFGTIEPDAKTANRLLLAQVQKTVAELQAEAAGSTERQAWQRDCNLRQRLHNARGG